MHGPSPAPRSAPPRVGGALMEAARALSQRLVAAVSPHQDDLPSFVRPRFFRAGEVIFRKGDPGDALYVILKGQVKIVLPSAEGEEALLATMDAGDFFGELSLLDGEPRSATVIAVEPTETMAFYRDGFAEFLRQSPDVALEILQALSKRLRQSDEVIADAAFLDVAGRLAKKLLELADRYGRPTANGVVIGTQVTQRDLAAMIGATRESVNKHLHSFRAQGMVAIERRRLVVRDAERLRRRIY